MMSRQRCTIASDPSRFVGVFVLFPVSNNEYIGDCTKSKPEVLQ